ncbi:HEAT repeat-containing protein 4 isoform X2 [Hyperolius riggenbachi]|uniref:HEAT repeat-containing protein 4 isoform X2 n=1 Tax=Hyperolius riggenbachi TaxID=752182 RepID=UPI0035A2A281
MELSTSYSQQMVFCLKPSQRLSSTRQHVSHYLHSVSLPTSAYCPSKQHSLQCQAKYIQSIAEDLHFSKEVVKDRGLSSLSYKEWDSKSIYNISHTTPQTKCKSFSRTRPKQHGICHLKPFIPTKDVKSRSCSAFKNGIWKKTQQNDATYLCSSTICVDKMKPKAFLTNVSGPGEHKEFRRSLICDSDKLNVNKKEVILTMLTKTTAQWLLAHQEGPMEGKERFCQHYGLPMSTQLIREKHMTEEDLKTCSDLEKTNLQDDHVLMEDSKPGTLLSAYYNIAGYVPLATKVEEIPPRWLQNTIDPKAGKYVCTNENQCEKELYSVVYDLGRSTQEISINASCVTDNKLKKVQPGPWNESYVLHNILSQWKSAWVIGCSWTDATLEQLTRDLSSVHKTSRISALVTIAAFAVDGPLQGVDPRDMNGTKSDGTTSQPPMAALPSEIQNLVSDALYNDDDLVKMAAALCQFFIQEFSEQAKKIMFSALEDGIDADSWAAAQCLALEGNHSHLVIQRILAQLFEVENKETEQQALYLLSLLSAKTTLIHCMLGEALSNSNWKTRIVACKGLSNLPGVLSQDLKNKLNQLMWKDWSLGVRKAAAKALNRLGLGKEVHNQIRKHLECDSWKSKVEALSLIRSLRTMTAQLYWGFLKCFSDDFATVRRQACQTAGLLQIKDDKVLECLCYIIQNDPVWKIQAEAIKAIGQIGHNTLHVRELLLWAVQLEEPGVRIEAYNCIAKLHLCDPDVHSALKERLTLESHGVAIRELKRTMKALNMEQHENQEMELLIKKQVSKLCQKEVLFPKILKLNEHMEAEQQEMKLLLQKSPNWKNKIREPEFLCSLVDKALSGSSGE